MKADLWGSSSVAKICEMCEDVQNLSVAKMGKDGQRSVPPGL